ncbi:MAG: hypothetical protein EXR65_04945 [Dehalococcoidia bacterium]|nr:hypothetical protein [Dehalococcoidia bacterium]
MLLSHATSIQNGRSMSRAGRATGGAGVPTPPPAPRAPRPAGRRRRRSPARPRTPPPPPPRRRRPARLLRRSSPPFGSLASHSARPRPRALHAPGSAAPVELEDRNVRSTLSSGLRRWTAGISTGCSAGAERPVR